MLTPRALAALLAVAALLAGCGDPTKKERAAQPVAARVNGEAITVPQIDLVLQQQPGLRPQQTDAAARVVLERLIHQQLAVQRAAELKLEREPRVQLQLDAARREVLARAYAEHVGAAAAKPNDDEIRRYYDEHPWLFAQRRIYQLQEFAVEARPDQVDALRAQLEATRQTGEFVEWLRANGYRFVATQAVRPAEQLPPAAAKAIAALDDGQALFNVAPTGVQIVVRAGSREQPVDFDAARPAIEQRMLAERRRALVRDDLLAQRQKARVEYVGAFAASPPPAVDPAASDVLPEASAPAR
ncbi:EpsD family peptidyl-prolyl cis-trans isomerase [Azohydromonas sediminis]|uniref:EpsD family peptidyl-prolyl cis-trans isomerase n=1 Tax=Azohydromonas sediminis TaxID=2259674 RepID=UPI000E65DCB1|nr:EpsD family peptidyl-prolyl cis-trans isomerase [Azohydromonas sediminis]